MNVKRIARLLAIVLTLVTMVSCLAVLMTTNVYAGNYKAYSASTLDTSMTGIYKINKSLSSDETELTLTATDNDPYFQISGLSDTILRTYPYVVIRYKSDHLGTFEIFSGHPNIDSCRVSMPVVPTNGQWGVLFYDFSVLDTNKKSWFRLEPMTVNGESIIIGEIVLFDTLSDADAYGYVYANAGYRSGATGGCVAITHNDFDYWNSANGRKGEVRTASIDIARKNSTRFKEGGYYTRLTANGSDPWVEFGNNTTMKNAANSYTYLSIRYRASGGSNIRVYTNTNSGTIKSAAADITGDQTWRWATITLNKDNSNFRLDYIDAGSASGLWIDIAEMYFHNGTEHIYNCDVGNNSDRQGNNDGRKLNVRMYFLHRDNYTYFENSNSVSKISTGSLAGNYRENQTDNFRYGSQSRTVVGRTFYYVAGTHSAHEDNGGTVTVQATCTAAGSTRYNCKLCNDQTRVDSTKPAALGHNGGAAATCTTAQICTRCSATVQAALGHNTAGSVAHKDATCTATGVAGGTYCTRCNNGKTAAEAILAALGHNAEGTVAHKDATCTETGVVGGTYCSRCNDGKSVVEAIIAALGHNSAGSVAHKDATCTETGVVGGTYCSRCNDGKSAVEAIIAALGHNAEGTVAHKDATCTETGVVGGTYCNRCNDGKSAVEAIIAALGHNAEGSVAHKDATCTETGVAGGTYCARCNEGKTAAEAILAALGHKEVVDAAKDPTCTETGLKEGKHCDRCKAVLIAQAIVDALGHVNVVDAAVAATCTETGLTEGCHCSRCSTVLTAQEVVAALGHNKVTDAAVDPTCTETGLTEGNHCGRCSVVLLAQEIVKALGHDEVIDAAVAPYCTTTGKTEGKHCDRCKATLIAQEIVAALGHVNVVDAAVAATCTETGLTEGCHCSRCEEVLTKQNVVDALGHDEKVDAAVAATCTETGLKEGKHCDRCKAVLIAQAIVDALGHDEVIDAAVAPYCTTTGKTEGKHCDRCDVVLIAQNVVDALGHDEVADAAVAADCTNAGKTAGKHCDRCKAVTVAQEIIAALGHNKETVVVIATATCTTAGSTEYSCSRCAELQDTVETPALGHDEKEVAATEPTYTTVGYTAGIMCDRCKEALGGGETIPTLNPLLTYNVALGERFAVNMKYVAFAGVSLKVVDEEGTEYAFTVTENVGTHTDGLAIYSIRIADISAQDIGHVFTVSETASGHSTGVSVKGYCDQVEALYGDKTEEEIAADFVEDGYDAATAQAMAAKTVLAHATTKKMDLYGRAAKNYFNQSGADHDGLATLIGDAYGATDSSREIKNTGEVIFKGATVVFGDVVELLFKMENYNHEKIYVDDVEVPADEIMDRLSTDGTYVYFSIFVKANELSHAFTVRAGSVEEDYIDYFAGSSTVTYSVDTYITSMQKKYATDESEKGKATMNLVNALGHYGASAVDYKKG